ncbi:SRPBCC family protein [Trinickia fusca]|uniref:Polyketide cyclase n=1 Tax=Trinickia fusca TaxID=2419777 RepID=A0A494XP27_9BURK|nr:SRPBCC family protein [Trinickia fusca]RKP49293.1 polyketide cyclase [Trinickia fusca]
MFKTLIIALIVVVGFVLIYAATKPDTFRVQRTVHIQAPPERVFALISNLRNFNTWNPFEKKDPAIQGHYSAHDSGAGASYAWESAKVGSGRMEIVSVTPSSNVTLKLDFIKPFEAHNMADFTLTPNAGGTDVTWAMHGPTPYFSKVMQVFISMDSMVGNDFAAGLANLKALAEGGASHPGAAGQTSAPNAS